MEKLSLDFAFEGFRIIRERPWLIVVWGVLLLAVNAISMVLSTYVFPGQLAALQTASAAQDDPTAVLTALTNLMPFVLTMLPITMLGHAVLSCAIYRSVLQGGRAGLAFLQVGGAEFRQVLLLILYFFITLVIYIAVVLGGMIVVMLLSFVLTLIHPALAAVGGVIGAIGIFVTVLWILGRLSLFGPQSFSEKQFNVFGSWSLTAGYGWTLFFGYFIMCIMMLVVTALCIGIFIALSMSLTGGGFTDTWKQLSSVSAIGIEIVHQPLLLAYMLTMSLFVSPLMQAMFYGAPAAAYRMLAGTTAKNTESVF